MSDPLQPEEGYLNQRRRWIFAGYISKGHRIFLLASLAIFTAYLAGSVPDPGFADQVLFILLRALRYSSLVLCAFSLFAMGFSIHRLVHVPKLSNILGLFLYFAAGILGAAFAMLDSFIIAAAEGNI